MEKVKTYKGIPITKRVNMKGEVQFITHEPLEDGNPLKFFGNTMDVIHSSIEEAEKYIATHETL